MTCVVTLPSLPVSESLLSVAREWLQNRELRRTRTKTVNRCYSRFFGVAHSRTGSRFDTVEVAGSSPVVPTIFSIALERIAKIL